MSAMAILRHSQSKLRRLRGPFDTFASLSRSGQAKCESRAEILNLSKDRIPAAPGGGCSVSE